MDPVLFLSFLAATMLIVATPGPAVALASSQAVRYGPRAALTTVAGDATGSVVHIVISVIGLQTLIGLSEVILPYLQMAGGMFILYMAWGSLRSVKHGDTPPQIATRATFFAGFFSCVTNPKAIVFFVALFPGFISPELNVVTQSLIYGAVFVALDAAFILGYAMLAMGTFRKVASPKLNIEHISGLGLLGVGMVLITKGYRALPSH
ncbi:MAG: LysE family translocator [Litoreibacter sp.]|uniref:LysE family translocator n=1 Tax=Litoreibacter sp. TaxID=1969459 RepID=UPI003296A0E2